MWFGDLSPTTHVLVSSKYRGGESVTICVQFQKHELVEENVWNKEGWEL